MNSLVKLQVRVTGFKILVGVVILIGLLAAYFAGTDRPTTFYAAIGATVFAILFWGIKLILLLRDAKAP